MESGPRNYENEAIQAHLLFPQILACFFLFLSADVPESSVARCGFMGLPWALCPGPPKQVLSGWSPGRQV